jgi:hypothetical protein
MEKLIKQIFKQFCKETKRSGGVLVHSSITEWHKYLGKKLEENMKKNKSPG